MQFLQPKVIENECFCKQHKQPIESVILDSKLSNDQRVLCKSCSKSNPNKAEIVNYLLLKEIFDRQQSERIKQYQPIIKPHIEYVENFYKVVDAFKTRLVRQLDNFLWLSKDWITNLTDIAQQYSFLGELDSFIKQSQFVVDQRNTMQNIKKINENWNIKIQKQLDQLNLQPEIKKCQDILFSLSRLIQNQEREINQEYSSHSKIQQPLKEELIYIRKDDFYQVLTQTKNFDGSYLNELLKLLRNQKITNCLEFFKNQSQLQFITSMIQNISEIDINQMNYSNDNYDQIRKELIQKISYDQNIIEFLKFLVSLTAIDERFIQCGSNALNLLVEMRVDLREHSFENIRIRDTSLIGGNFVRCNFNGSEYDNVDISGMNLNQAQLFNCKWKNIKIYELNRLDGHSSWVNSVNFSPDGTTLASGGGFLFGGDDNSIRLWDVKTGQQKAKLDGHSERVCSVNFSPDGTTLVSGSQDKSIRLWDVKTGQQKAKLDGHSEAVYSVNFSPDGTTLASGSKDNSIRLWDLKTSKEILQSDRGYKDLLSQFKIPLQNSSLLPNVNPDRTIHRICQNPLFEASGTLILQGQFINHQGKDLKPLFKSKGSCFLEDLKQK